MSFYVKENSGKDNLNKESYKCSNDSYYEGDSDWGNDFIRVIDLEFGLASIEFYFHYDDSINKWKAELNFYNRGD